MLRLVVTGASWTCRMPDEWTLCCTAEWHLLPSTGRYQLGIYLTFHSSQILSTGLILTLQRAVCVSSAHSSPSPPVETPGLSVPGATCPSPSLLSAPPGNWCLCVILIFSIIKATLTLNHKAHQVRCEDKLTVLKILGPPSWPLSRRIHLLDMALLKPTFPKASFYTEIETKLSVNTAPMLQVGSIYCILLWPKITM